MFVKTEERPQGEEQKAKTLKLSEAIRIGARIRPQCRRDLFFEGGSCALGAAYEAVIGRTDYYSEECPPVEKVFPQLYDKVGSETLETQIWDRNDDLGWTREQIADWLESQGY